MSRNRKELSVKNLIYLIFFLIFSPILQLQFAYAFSPQSDSPLANHSHPRLHITQQIIPTLKQTIAQHYKNKYQQYVH